MIYTLKISKISFLNHLYTIKLIYKIIIENFHYYKSLQFKL